MFFEKIIFLFFPNIFVFFCHFFLFFSDTFFVFFFWIGQKPRKILTKKKKKSVRKNKKKVTKKKQYFFGKNKNIFFTKTKFSFKGGRIFFSKTNEKKTFFLTKKTSKLSVLKNGQFQFCPQKSIGPGTSPRPHGTYKLLFC